MKEFLNGMFRGLVILIVAALVGPWLCGLLDLYVKWVVTFFR